MIRKIGVVLTFAALFVAPAPAASAANFTWGPNFTITNSNADVIDMFGSSIKCTNTSFDGEVPQFSPTLTLSPSFNSCTAFGLPATAESPKDAWTFTGDGTLHINEEVRFTVFTTSAHTTALCHLVIPAQTPSGKATYTNKEDGSLSISGKVAGITATQVRNSAFCPPGLHTTLATYTFSGEGIVIKDETGTVSFHVK